MVRMRRCASLLVLLLLAVDAGVSADGSLESAASSEECPYRRSQLRRIYQKRLASFLHAASALKRIQRTVGECDSLDLVADYGVSVRHAVDGQVLHIRDGDQVFDLKVGQRRVVEQPKEDDAVEYAEFAPRRPRPPFRNAHRDVPGDQKQTLIDYFRQFEPDIYRHYEGADYAERRHFWESVASSITTDNRLIVDDSVLTEDHVSKASVVDDVPAYSDAKRAPKKDKAQQSAESSGAHHSSGHSNAQQVSEYSDAYHSSEYSNVSEYSDARRSSEYSDKQRLPKNDKAQQSAEHFDAQQLQKNDKSQQSAEYSDIHHSSEYSDAHQFSEDVTVLQRNESAQTRHVFSDDTNVQLFSGEEEHSSDDGLNIEVRRPFSPPPLRTTPPAEITWSVTLWDDAKKREERVETETTPQPTESTSDTRRRASHTPMPPTPGPRHDHADDDDETPLPTLSDATTTHQQGPQRDNGSRLATTTSGTPPLDSDMDLDLDLDVGLDLDAGLDSYAYEHSEDHWDLREDATSAMAEDVVEEDEGRLCPRSVLAHLAQGRPPALSRPEGRAVRALLRRASADLARGDAAVVLTLLGARPAAADVQRLRRKYGRGVDKFLLRKLVAASRGDALAHLCALLHSQLHVQEEADAPLDLGAFYYAVPGAIQYVVQPFVQYIPGYHTVGIHRVDLIQINSVVEYVVDEVVQGNLDVVLYVAEGRLGERVPPVIRHTIEGLQRKYGFSIRTYIMQHVYRQIEETLSESEVVQLLARIRGLVQKYELAVIDQRFGLGSVYHFHFTQSERASVRRLSQVMKEAILAGHLQYVHYLAGEEEVGDVSADFRRLMQVLVAKYGESVRQYLIDVVYSDLNRDHHEQRHPHHGPTTVATYHVNVRFVRAADVEMVEDLVEYVVRLVSKYDFRIVRYLVDETTSFTMEEEYAKIVKMLRKKYGKVVLVRVLELSFEAVQQVLVEENVREFEKALTEVGIIVVTQYKTTPMPSRRSTLAETSSSAQPSPTTTVLVNTATAPSEPAFETSTSLLASSTAAQRTIDFTETSLVDFSVTPTPLSQVQMENITAIFFNVTKYVHTMEEDRELVVAVYDQVMGYLRQRNYSIISVVLGVGESSEVSKTFVHDLEKLTITYGKVIRRYILRLVYEYFVTKSEVQVTEEIRRSVFQYVTVLGMDYGLKKVPIVGETRFLEYVGLARYVRIAKEDRVYVNEVIQYVVQLLRGNRTAHDKRDALVQLFLDVSTVTEVDEEVRLIEERLRASYGPHIHSFVAKEVRRVLGGERAAVQLLIQAVLTVMETLEQRSQAPSSPAPHQMNHALSDYFHAAQQIQVQTRDEVTVDRMVAYVSRMLAINEYFVLDYFIDGEQGDRVDEQILFTMYELERRYSQVVRSMIVFRAYEDVIRVINVDAITKLEEYMVHLLMRRSSSPQPPAESSSAQPQMTTQQASASTSAYEEPTTTIFAEPSSESTQEQSTLLTQEPSTALSLEPSTALSLEPSTELSLEPSTALSLEPSTGETTELSTSQPSQPSSEASEQPYTSMTEELSSSLPLETASAPEEPSTQASAQPTPAEPSTVQPVEPSSPLPQRQSSPSFASASTGEPSDFIQKFESVITEAVEKLLKVLDQMAERNEPVDETMSSMRTALELALGLREGGAHQHQDVVDAVSEVVQKAHTGAERASLVRQLYARLLQGARAKFYYSYYKRGLARLGTAVDIYVDRQERHDDSVEVRTDQVVHHRGDQRVKHVTVDRPMLTTPPDSDSDEGIDDTVKDEDLPCNLLKLAKRAVRKKNTELNGKDHYKLLKVVEQYHNEENNLIIKVQVQRSNGRRRMIKARYHKHCDRFE